MQKEIRKRLFIEPGPDCSVDVNLIDRAPETEPEREPEDWFKE
jgi:hypothetical protein